jgi:23S rRNA (cytidine1920-2'-O)/16S rRNA (cytidine1409-2'-O)-methyltransferase
MPWQRRPQAPRQPAGRLSTDMVAFVRAAHCELDHSAMKRIRLDQLLFERGIFPSRSKAAASVLAGEVLLLPERRRASKPGQLVASEAELELQQRERFVSRGGLKLEHGLDAFHLDVAGRRALDVGASTGGFTDCLLARGVAQVTCVDVAYGQLDYRLRTDPRVTVIERCNARWLRREDLPYAPEVIVIDVSFISLEKVLPAVLSCAAPQFDCLALVKPQFEAGRESVGKGGVVRDAQARRQALLAVGEAGRRLGVSVLGYASAGLPGPKGNRESFVWLAEGERRGLSELVPAVGEVEP